MRVARSPPGQRRDLPVSNIEDVWGALDGCPPPVAGHPPPPPGPPAWAVPAMAPGAACRHGARIVGAIDARGVVVAVEGWREETQLQAKSFLQKLASLGVPRFVYTDINRDAMLDSPNYEMIETMVGATERPLIAAGGVADVEHLTRLSKLGVEGAIVGLALYDGRLDLREAIAAVR